MKARRFLAFIGMILFGLALLCNAYAEGLSISPASYKWNGVQVGSLLKCPSSIMVKNTSKGLISYTLRAVRPENLGVGLDEGYSRLPSCDWVSFSQKRLTVGPGQWKQVDVFIEIPKDKKYLGKKWDFFIEVKEYPAGGRFFALACYSRLYIAAQENFAEEGDQK